VRRSLASRGFRPTLFDDGAAALQAIEAGLRPDLVLTDVVMPQVGGLALVKRARELLPDARVLLMTGYAEPRELGTDESIPVLAKPFTPRSLVAAVRAALDAAPSRAPTTEAVDDVRGV
jgi:CheY-like chemotaxis protein